MSKILTTYRDQRRHLAGLIKTAGIRQTALRTKLTPMAVSRYVSNNGSDDAYVHFILAAAAGYSLPLVPTRRLAKQAT